MAGLPHDSYITAVADALTAAGLAPTEWWTSGAESNRYDGDGLASQLDAVLTWDGEHPAIDPDRYPDGLVLAWEHPAEEWRWAEREAHGVLRNEPDFLSALPRWAAPDAVVAVVRELLAGRPMSSEPAAPWGCASDEQAAVDAWAAEGGEV